MYDVLEDPYELNNLAAKPALADALAAMRARLENIRTSSNDVLPTERMQDDFFRETGYPTKYRIRPRPSKAAYLEARQQGIVLVNPEFEEQ